MSNAHAADHSIENPGNLKASALMNGVFGAMVAVGAVAFLMALSNDPTTAWTAFLRAHFYFLSISLAAVFFLAIHWITTAMWDAPVIRVAEGFTAYIPFTLFSSVILMFGAHTLFKWTDPALMHSDPVIMGKTGYLNMSFWVIRTLIGVVAWIYFSRKLVGGSLSLDAGAPFRPVYEKSRKLAVIFFIFYAITFSYSAFDQLMSLDPHFFSTMFGVYTFAGSYQAFFATLAIVTILMRRAGYLKNLVNENHIHDISKMMFAFTVFWAYTGFSQYMLIWYANLPEETGYFMLRFNEHWENWSICLFVGRFFVPFFLLLPRGNKRCEELVFLTACWVLIMHYMDLNWMIQPVFFNDGPRFAFADIGTWIGFLGVAGLLVSRFYQKNNVVSTKNPYLPESVFHHHI